MILNCEGKKLIRKDGTIEDIKYPMEWKTIWTNYYAIQDENMSVGIWDFYDHDLSIQFRLFNVVKSNITFDTNNIDNYLSLISILENIITERFNKVEFLNDLIPPVDIVIGYEFEDVLNFFNSGYCI